MNLVSTVISTSSLTGITHRHQAIGVLAALPDSRHNSMCDPTYSSIWWHCRRFCGGVFFKVKDLPDPCTRSRGSTVNEEDTPLDTSKLMVTRTVFIILGLFFDLYWSRTRVFCCASSVWSGITQDRVLHLTAAPREGCGSSPRTKVLELGEVIDCTSLVPWIWENPFAPYIYWYMNSESLIWIHSSSWRNTGWRLSQKNK